MSYSNLIIRKCTGADIDKIMLLQKQIIEGLENKDLLRENSRENFELCLENQSLILGVSNELEELIAIAILYDGRGTDEDLGKELKFHEVSNGINFKLVMVREDYRGRRLQKALMWMLEQYAYSEGFTHLCATVSPFNQYSVNNIEEMGYVYDHSELKYGGKKRAIYVKNIENSVKEYTDAILKNNPFTEALDLSRYIEGESKICNTGDVLEYIDTANGEKRYALFIKNSIPEVAFFSKESNEMKVTEYSERIETMIFQRALINTVKGV